MPLIMWILAGANVWAAAANDWQPLALGCVVTSVGLAFNASVQKRDKPAPYDGAGKGSDPTPHPLP